MQYKPIKCTFSKLVLQFSIVDVFYMFRPLGSSSGRRMYLQVWYSVFYMRQYDQSSRKKTVLDTEFYHYTIPYCIYIRLPEDEPRCPNM